MPSRLSDDIHDLRGTKPRLTAHTESQFSAGKPKCPAHFTEDEKTKWREIVKLLAARRVLTKADAPFLQLYVETYFRHQSLLQDLKK